MSYELKCKLSIKDHFCNADVDTFTEQISESVSVRPTVIDAGPVVIKIPVVLTETKIIIPVVSEIRLESKASEIKCIKKNVYVTQCHLIPNSSIGDDNTSGLLFLEGFVRKNIEYATKDCMNDAGIVSGNIKHTTVKVLFSTTARVQFRREPQFQVNGATTEFDLFNDTLKTCDACAENIIGKDPCEEGFIHKELFNEKVYCELINTNIIEADTHKHPKSLGFNNPEEQTFNKITEKMILTLAIKLLQNQQVTISSGTACPARAPKVTETNKAIGTLSYHGRRVRKF